MVSRGKPHLPVGGFGGRRGGFGRAAHPGVGTYDADPGHEEQHGSQGQAHAVVAHGIEDGSEFLLADASEHAAAGTLPAEAEGLGRGWERGAAPPAEEPAPRLRPVISASLPGLRVIVVL